MAKRCGFTLAEVLIVISIIGVIAQITIPPIVNNVQDSELVSASKKGYSIINQMLMNYRADTGDDYSGLFPDGMTNDDAMNIMAPYFKISKLCKSNQVCWPEHTKYLNPLNNGHGTYGTDGGAWGSYSAAAILADGSRIAVRKWGDGCSLVQQCDSARDANGNFILDGDGNPTPVICNFTNCGSINIDVNGNRGPNQWGKDTFEFRIYKTKISGCGWSTETGCLETVLSTDKPNYPK